MGIAGLIGLAELGFEIIGLMFFFGSAGSSACILVYHYVSKKNKQTAFVLATTIGLYVLAVAGLIFISEHTEEILGLMFFFLVSGISTCILVYHFVTLNHKKSAPIVLHTTDTHTKEIRKLVQGLLWSVVAFVYLLIGFVVMGWAWGWIVFLLAEVVNSLLQFTWLVQDNPKTIVMDKRQFADIDLEEEKNSEHNKKLERKKRGHLSSAFWSLLVAIYFMVSFATVAWNYTWLIFILGGIAQMFIDLMLKLKEKP